MKKPLLNKLVLSSCVLVYVCDFAFVKILSEQHTFPLWLIIFCIIGVVLFLKNKIVINKRLIVFFAILFTHNILCHAIYSKVNFFSWLILLVLFFICVIAYSIFRIIEPVGWLEVVATAGIIVALSVIFEFFLNLAYPAASKTIIYNFFKYNKHFIGVRASGLMSEPSNVAYLLPAAFFYFVYLKRKIISLIIAVASLLSFSLLTYVTFTFAVIIILSKKKSSTMQKVFILIIVVMSLITISFLGMEPLNKRGVAMNKVIQSVAKENSELETEEKSIQTLGGTVGTLYVSGSAALWSLIETNGFGSGLNRFSSTIDQYVKFQWGIPAEEIGKKLYVFKKLRNGESLMIRIIGEFGLAGCAFVLIIIHRCLMAIMNYRKQISNIFNRNTLINKTNVAHVCFCVTIFPALLRMDAYLDVYVIFSAIGILLMWPIGKKRQQNKKLLNFQQRRVGSIAPTNISCSNSGLT